MEISKDPKTNQSYIISELTQIPVKSENREDGFTSFRKSFHLYLLTYSDNCPIEHEE